MALVVTQPSPPLAVFPSSGSSSAGSPAAPPTKGIRDDEKEWKITDTMLQVLGQKAMEHAAKPQPEDFVNLTKQDLPGFPKTQLFFDIQSSTAYFYIKKALTAKPKKGRSKQFGKALCYEFKEGKFLQEEEVARLRLNPDIPSSERKVRVEALNKEVGLLTRVKGQEHLCQIRHSKAYLGKAKIKGDVKSNDSKQNDTDTKISKFIMYQKLYEDEDLMDHVGAQAAWLKEPDTISRFIRQLLEALSIIHQLNISHRDVKFENIFLLNGNFHLSDFDLALDSQERDGRNAGTPGFFAPEKVCLYWDTAINLLGRDGKEINMNRSSGDPKADMWAFGICLWALVHDFNPHRAFVILDDQSGLGPREARLEYCKLLNTLHNEPRPVGNPIKEILWWCLRPDPHERPSADEALELFNMKSRPGYKEPEQSDLFAPLPPLPKKDLSSKTAINIAYIALAMLVGFVAWKCLPSFSPKTN